MGACLVLLKRHRPWQQRELSAYLTVKACEKKKKGDGWGERKEEWRLRGMEGAQHWKGLGVDPVKLDLCVVF